MSKQEVYKSTTLGPIPLSFTGRHLLQNLREAMADLIAKVVKDVEAGVPVVASKDWEPVSRARGRLAQYISGLERGERWDAVEVKYSPDCKVDPRNPPAPAESSAAMLRRLGTDGDAWAKEFCIRCSKYSPDVVFDQDSARAWFANAIEAGKQSGYRTGQLDGNREACDKMIRWIKDLI